VFTVMQLTLCKLCCRQVGDGGGVRTTVFPSLRPDRRSDVVLLELWLTDTMRLLSAQFPTRPASEDTREVPTLDSVLSIHVNIGSWSKPLASAISHEDLSILWLIFIIRQPSRHKCP